MKSKLGYVTCTLKSLLADVLQTILPLPPYLVFPGHYAEPLNESNQEAEYDLNETDARLPEFPSSSCQLIIDEIKKTELGEKEKQMCVGTHKDMAPFWSLTTGW